MCGIVGYIGPNNAIPVIISGLERLEYRGYDSAGLAFISNKKLKAIKTSGKVQKLKAALPPNLKSNIAIGHTRWATHGVPSNENAHPHLSMDKNLALIHNGIIENYVSIKEGLRNRGYEFTSETDTEVLINLISDVKQNESISLFEAVKLALTQVIGAYSIAILDSSNPNILVVAKKGSPLLIGVGDKEYFIASDPTPFLKYTKDVIYLNENSLNYVIN